MSDGQHETIKIIEDSNIYIASEAREKRVDEFELGARHDIVCSQERLDGQRAQITWKERSIRCE
jgi:hypothetical protein